MTTMEQLREGLDGARGRWPTISRETGVDYFTICRIARGDTQNPRIETVERIQRWLQRNRQKHTA